MMTLDTYIANRLESDPEFRAVYEASRPQFEFRLKLSRARLSAGLSQEQLVEQTGIKPSAISRLEGGDAKPSLDMLRRLAAALNVSFEILPTAAIEIHQFDPTQS